MQLFLDRFISYIAPHQCLGCNTDGDLLCPYCIQLFPQLESQCYKCQKITLNNRTCQQCSQTSPLFAVHTITLYESVAKTLLKQLKFERNIAAAPLIAKLLHQAYAIQVRKGAVLVPVPTATGRIRQRGYDQSVVIAKLLAQTTKLPCCSVLQKYGQTRQTSSSRTERFEQIKQTLTVAKPEHIQAKEVLLIDDVITTGATLEAAAELLLQAGARRVSAITFARTL